MWTPVSAQWAHWYGHKSEWQGKWVKNLSLLNRSKCHCHHMWNSNYAACTFPPTCVAVARFGLAGTPLWGCAPKINHLEALHQHPLAWTWSGTVSSCFQENVNRTVLSWHDIHMESPNLVSQVPFSQWLKDENWDRRRYIYLIEETWVYVRFSVVVLTFISPVTR